MAAKKSIEYEIYMTDKKYPYLKPTKGYPICLPVSGQFAIRHWGGGIWTVDHVDTGFAVVTAKGRKVVLAAAILIARNKGEEGFQAAIKEAKKRRELVQS